MCDDDFGGCWHGFFDGEVLSACVDLLGEYKELAVEGKANDSTPLFKCECPPCFHQADDGSCQQMCRREDCNKAEGGCVLGLVGTAAATRKGIQ